MINDLDLRESVFLKAYTTFQLGGPCLGFTTCESPDQLCRVVNALRMQKKHFEVIGEGSNILASDKGLDCFVIRYLRKAPDLIRERDKIIVSASTLTDDIALWAAQNGLSGLNFLSGIPGTLGGAIIGNAGSFGQQISSALSQVMLVGSDGKLIRESPQTLCFGYRHSRMKEKKEIVAKAEFLLKSASAKELLAQRKKILALRRKKHPDYHKIPCAGSFFKNIEQPSGHKGKKAAGWFLDQVDAKTMSVGGAGVFEKHANILIKKTPECTAQDVYRLSCLMQKTVKERFGICLNPEVCFLGNFDNHL